ncbi:MAG: hypothetical protein JNN08_20835 [Bryobacterales bacterium]|nr:hypothetical protein [Bryobacterales bacterium]
MDIRVGGERRAALLPVRFGVTVQARLVAGQRRNVNRDIAILIKEFFVVGNLGLLLGQTAFSARQQ